MSLQLIVRDLELLLSAMQQLIQVLISGVALLTSALALWRQAFRRFSLAGGQHEEHERSQILEAKKRYPAAVKRASHSSSQLVPPHKEC